MADSNENVPVGGGQPPSNPLGSPQQDAEEKAMRKGKGRMMTGMIIAAVAGLGALVFYMVSGADGSYQKFRNNVNTYDQKYFDGFWYCAFEGYNPGEIKNNKDLQNQINIRARNGGSEFGEFVKDDCISKLEKLDTKLGELIPPEDMKKPWNELRQAVDRLRSAWDDFIGYLQGLEAGYEASAASDKVTGIAKAWFDYRKTITELDDQLAKKLGQDG